MDEEVKLIHEEFKIWKKNTPFLYDLVITQALEWPSLTVQWLPGYETIPDKDSTLHTLLLGTHTSSNVPNALILAHVLLPDPNASEINMEHFSDDSVSLGELARPSNRIRPFKAIAHDGEVNRARCNPFNKDVVVTKTIDGNVFLFNTTNQPDRSVAPICNPDLRLLGHTQEGYGLSWNSFQDGQIVSGSDDCKVLVWNVQKTPDAQKGLEPIHTFSDHGKGVMDVSWNPDHSSIFGSVSDDQYLHLYDLRRPQGITARMKAHNSEINCLAFNPVNAVLIATGASEKTIALIDTRNMTTPLHILEGHSEAIYMVSWNSTRNSLLGSCGADRRAMVWDVSRIGLPQTDEEREDGPPELLFVHGGHTSRVLDFSWNSNVDHEIVAATNAEDNILQVWQLAESLFEEKAFI